jgi:hypothetical protein
VEEWTGWAPVCGHGGKEKRSLIGSQTKTYGFINGTLNLILLSNSRELIPAREAKSCLPTQEIPSILWNLKVQCHVHNLVNGPHPEPDKLSNQKPICDLICD